jgi:hypothetical protein
MDAVLREAGDPGGYMTAERLRSWARVARAIFADTAPPPVAVTTSRAVVETLAERVDAFEEAARFDAVPGGPGDHQAMERWRGQLVEFIEALISGHQVRLPSPPKAAAEAPGLTLILYAARGMAMARLLKVAAGEPVDVTAEEVVEPALVALVEGRI